MCTDDNVQANECVIIESLSREDVFARTKPRIPFLENILNILLHTGSEI